MTLLSTVAGFSAFGFGVRCFQLGLQKRNIFSRPFGHVASVVGFGSLGYYLYHVEQRQTELIAQKKKQLLAHREAEQSI